MQIGTPLRQFDAPVAAGLVGDCGGSSGAGPFLLRQIHAQAFSETQQRRSAAALRPQATFARASPAGGVSRGLLVRAVLPQRWFMPGGSP
jgi:hypothetical protein